MEAGTAKESGTSAQQCKVRRVDNNSSIRLSLQVGRKSYYREPQKVKSDAKFLKASIGIKEVAVDADSSRTIALLCDKDKEKYEKNLHKFHVKKDIKRALVKSLDNNNCQSNSHSSVYNGEFLEFPESAVDRGDSHTLRSFVPDLHMTSVVWNEVTTTAHASSRRERDEAVDRAASLAADEDYPLRIPSLAVRQLVEENMLSRDRKKRAMVDTSSSGNSTISSNNTINDDNKNNIKRTRNRKSASSSSTTTESASAAVAMAVARHFDMVTKNCIDTVSEHIVAEQLALKSAEAAAMARWEEKKIRWEKKEKKRSRRKRKKTAAPPQPPLPPPPVATLSAAPRVVNWVDVLNVFSSTSDGDSSARKENNYEHSTGSGSSNSTSSSSKMNGATSPTRVQGVTPAVLDRVKARLAALYSVHPKIAIGGAEQLCSTSSSSEPAIDRSILKRKQP